MNSAFKSFFWVLVLIGLLTLGSVYLSKSLFQKRAANFVASQESIKPAKKYDDSLPFTIQNAKFNLSEDKAVLDEGQFGLISEVKIDDKTGMVTIKFDQTRLYKGEDAEKAARADLGCDKSPKKAECAGTLAPTGEYISNPIRKVFEYKLTPDAVIKLLSYANKETGTGIKISTPTDLQQLMSTYDISDVAAGNKQFLTAWIIEKNGEISYLEQQLLK